MLKVEVHDNTSLLRRHNAKSKNSNAVYISRYFRRCFKIIQYIFRRYILRLFIGYKIYYSIK